MSSRGKIPRRCVLSSFGLHLLYSRESACQSLLGISVGDLSLLALDGIFLSKVLWGLSCWCLVTFAFFDLDLGLTDGERLEDENVDREYELDRRDDKDLD